MNAYKNLYEKVKALLKIDDNLTTKEAEAHQWQLLIKVGEYNFAVGKGGITTMFFTETSADRVTCYPEDMVNILKDLQESKIFVYEALSKKKKPIGYSYALKKAQAFKGAYYIKAVNFKGKKKTVSRKEKDLYNKSVWQKVGK